MSDLYFSVDVKDINNILSNMARVVNSKTTVPILNSLLMSVNGSIVTLTATDLDRALETSIDCDASDDFEFSVNVANLRSFIAALAKIKCEKVDFTIKDEHRVVISSGHRRVELPILPAADFPRFSADDFNHEFSLMPEDLLHIFGRTIFAASTDDTRYYLNGIYLYAGRHWSDLEGDAGFLVGVATDGHRLGRASIELPKGAEGLEGIIVPYAMAQDVLALAGKFNCEIEVAINPGQIRFVIGDTTIISKLIDGTFPDYQRSFPRDNPLKCTFETKSLSASVEIVSSVHSTTNGIRLDFKRNKIAIRMTDTNGIESSDVVAVKYSGATQEIGLNSTYLLSILAGTAAREMIVALKDTGSPLILHEKDNTDVIFIIMPMRVGGKT